MAPRYAQRYRTTYPRQRKKGNVKSKLTFHCQIHFKLIENPFCLYLDYGFSLSVSFMILLHISIRLHFYVVKLFKFYFTDRYFKDDSNVLRIDSVLLKFQFLSRLL